MNKRPVRFFRSLTFKLYTAAAACVLLLLTVNLALSVFVFSDIYQTEKRNTLIQTFEELDAVSATPETVLPHVEQLSNQYPALMIWNDYRILFSKGYYHLSSFVAPAPLEMKNGTCTVTDRPLQGQNPSTSYNRLVLYGRTKNGLNVVLELPLTDNDSVAVTNRILLFSSLITLMISAVVVWFLSRCFTRPISRLSAMAQNMADLNFRDRYHSYGHDELAELGNSLNAVSETMETTLSELKTANVRLTNDMESIEQQNEARRSFISNVSHELKTPIALIQTYAEGLQENVAEDAEQRAFYCEVIGDEAQRLSQIISRMTMLMQLESGKEELQIERFDIRRLCERLCERNTPLFAQQNITLLPLPSAETFVWGDAALIENVMTNYLSNALHHTPQGGSIRLDWTPTERNTLRICVYNSGSPIPEDDLPRIWESFYKVDKAHTRAYGGSGIGLSVVAAIMRVHRMAYGVRNLPDGVEFYIELPLK